MIKYNTDELRAWALLLQNVGRSVAVPPRDMLAILDDLERYKHALERIVGWDYPCRDDGCEAGEVAAKAFEEK